MKSNIPQTSWPNIGTSFTRLLNSLWGCQAPTIFFMKSALVDVKRIGEDGWCLLQLKILRNDQQKGQTFQQHTKIGACICPCTMLIVFKNMQPKQFWGWVKVTALLVGEFNIVAKCLWTQCSPELHGWYCINSSISWLFYSISPQHAYMLSATGTTREEEETMQSPAVKMGPRMG